MVLKIIASHGTHYKDGAFDVALWSQPALARYIGEPPYGIFTTDEAIETKDDGSAVATSDTVIPYYWPVGDEDLGHDYSQPISVRQISYHNAKGAPGEQEELYIGEGCTVYLMTDEGKTIERLI